MVDWYERQRDTDTHIHTHRRGRENSIRWFTLNVWAGVRIRSLELNPILYVGETQSLDMSPLLSGSAKARSWNQELELDIKLRYSDVGYKCLNYLDICQLWLTFWIELENSFPSFFLLIQLPFTVTRQRGSFSLRILEQCDLCIKIMYMLK